MEIPISAKAALLQVLLEGPGYGTELMKRVQERTGGEVRLLQGSLYPALKHLEEEGYVVIFESNGKALTNYKLTSKGKTLAMSQKEVLEGIVRQPKRVG